MTIKSGRREVLARGCGTGYILTPTTSSPLSINFTIMLLGLLLQVTPASAHLVLAHAAQYG